MLRGLVVWPILAYNVEMSSFDDEIWHSPRSHDDPPIVWVRDNTDFVVWVRDKQLRKNSNGTAIHCSMVSVLQ